MRGGVSWDMSSTVIQSGLPRPLGGYQPIVEPHSPAPAWHMHHQILPKQEPVEERNDSGINSCSDSHSSPGSDHSQDYNAPTYPFGNLQNHYSPSTTPRIHPNPGIYQQSGFNRENPTIPPTQEDANPKTPIKNETRTSPIPQNAEAEDHLHRLQMSLEKNGLLSQPLSPKLSEHSMDDDNKSDLEIDEYDEQGLRIPKVNSHGKVKTFKCKQCDFIAITKLDFWEHSKGHIKADKLLTCPKCPFVTEYKHHLEYHLRNHFGSKPFKCNKCSYSCVNKSMLNSHMKSHSNIYQYRCADCSYATKYCHSLKLHLRKYGHKPAMVLNPDGTPNPLPIIDVYGTRRGPKQKIHAKQDDMEGTPQAIHNSLAQFMLNASPQMQLPFPYPFLGGFPGALGSSLLFQQNLVQLAAQRSASPEPIEEEEDVAPPSTKNEEAEALDLSKPDAISHDQQPATKSRRKGKAFKIDRLAIDRQDSSNDEEEEEESADKTNTSGDEEENNTKGEDETKNNNNNPGNYSCHFCCISFGDVVLYTMHMGYHGYKDPFTCNMCGEECNDKVSFFLHIARTSHS